MALVLASSGFSSVSDLGRVVRETQRDRKSDVLDEKKIWCVSKDPPGEKVSMCHPDEKWSM